MSSKISIANIPKALLLKELWNRSHPAAFFAISGFPAPDYDEKEALAEAEKCQWVLGYILGRPIKADLSRDETDPTHYDCDVGEGAFKEVVDSAKLLWVLD
ncbi:hypothetical protein BDV18DRAFT_164608 [Aspergillus unguis]